MVHIPTWFWVEEPYRTTLWQERAELPTGTPRVWAEAFPEPEWAEWFPGDGTGWMPCPTLGTVWQAGLPEDATDCAHSYERSSAGRTGDAYQAQGRV